MTLAIKVIILFVLVESSWEYVVNPFAEENQINQGKSEIDYFERWFENGATRSRAKISSLDIDQLRGAIFILTREARSYVQLWGRRKNRIGYPLGDLRNKLQGDLWPIEYGDRCRHSSIWGYKYIDVSHIWL